MDTVLPEKGKTLILRCLIWARFVLWCCVRFFLLYDALFVLLLKFSRIQVLLHICSPLRLLTSRSSKSVQTRRFNGTRVRCHHPTNSIRIDLVSLTLLHYCSSSRMFEWFLPVCKVPYHVFEYVRIRHAERSPTGFGGDFVQNRYIVTETRVWLVYSKRIFGRKYHQKSNTCPCMSYSNMVEIELIWPGVVQFVLEM